MTMAEEPTANAPSEEAAPAKAAAPAKEAGVKRPKIEIVKPNRWDLIALAVLAVTVVLQGANLQLAFREGQGAISGSVTGVFVILQLALCLVGLMVLGKTAKEGTIWGNLFSVGACVAGMSGVLLASALWALA